MAELFKFRCYQCQKLIGAPASKFGKVVKCPRCEAELIVPSPEGVEPPPEPADPDAFRPEELGIQLESESIRPPRPAPANVSVLEPVGDDPIAFLKQVNEELNSEPSKIVEHSAEESSPPPGELEALPEPVPEPLVTRGRGRSSSARLEPTVRARDVILPRTAAVAWSLFGLLGLAFAFASGMLIGHFLWK